jgi:glycosyltransferase involved in cell wall biosynthesis
VTPRPAIRTVLVVIPTYDEAETLPGVLRRVRDAAPAVDVLVVDDNSPDGTGEIAEKLAADDDRLFVLHQPGKSGLGSAYRAGFGWACQRGYDAVVEMDADGSHPPELLPHLLEHLADADVVLGSRWVPGGRVVNWPRHRMLLSRGGNTYARWALGLPLADATGGYRVYRRTVLEAIDLPTVASQGYCFQVDLAWRAWRTGFRVVEVPITFVERAAGRSKMSHAIVAEALWRVSVWGVRSLPDRLTGRPPGRRGRQAGWPPCSSSPSSSSPSPRSTF